MEYLATSYYFDYEDQGIQQLVQDFRTDDSSLSEKAAALYLKVRDTWRYNPYYISLSKEEYRASYLLGKKDGHCIDKSIILIAGLRALGIPARLHLAKVKNHIGVERLIEKFGTNELTPHGMVNIFLDGKWLKVSPAFNIELCEKCNVAPLDFDGKQDSIFQQYDKAGNAFMEYLEDYGHFEDFPFDFILQNMMEHYPEIAEKFAGKSEFRLD